jgi:hypothetical protein
MSAPGSPLHLVPPLEAAPIEGEHVAVPPTIDDLTADALDHLRAWRLALARGVSLEDLEVLVTRLLQADERLEDLEAEAGSR